MRTLFGLAVLLSTSLAIADDDGKIPGVDFPVTDTTAKVGENVFTVNKLQIERFAKDTAAGKPAHGILYISPVLEAGAKTSKVKVVGSKDGDVVPNSLVIPIPKGAKAKVGDIIVAPWALSMKRAIVIKDGAAPTVLFIDLSYDNPAKNKAGVGVAQEENAIAADTFFVLGKGLAPGAISLCSKKLVQVVKISGDKILTLNDAGQFQPFAKTDCTWIDPGEKFKAGDKVYADFVGTLKPAVVTKVDAKIGRVFLNFDLNKKKEVAIAFGRLTAKAP